MSFPNKIKAIVLTCDRYRAITRHVIFQYDRLWPDHPFVFHIPYQELGGTDTKRVKYLTSPSDIKGTVLHLLANIDDEEWIYWCVDDKYPIELPTLSSPRLTLYPDKIKNLFGDIYLERKGWSQIWIHQILRAKVLRHLFTHLPDHIPSAKAMDDLKDEVAKLPEHRLFVTEKNFAVFGESTRRGDITQNCYESMMAAGIELPEWFQHPNGEYVTLGKL